MGRRSSYTAANAIPVKLFLNGGAKSLRPIHISWYPTNQCNRACKYCSCANRDKTQAMDIDTARDVIRNFASLGCKAVSISGGGEPLCHPHLADMIAEFRSNGIEVGLVTNGLLLDTLNMETLDMLTWCRISNDDSRTFNDEYRQLLDTKVAADVDWAFSHVVGSEPNVDEIVRIVKYANLRGFTHVRLVGDIREPQASDWSSVRLALSGIDDLVIYQERKTFVACDRCLLGYIKPVVAPDWHIYLCCGVQYALKDMTFDMPESLRMGDARNLGAIYNGRRLAFKVECTRCYYGDYHPILEALTSEVSHKEFV